MAVGLVLGDTEAARGWGVTNVEHPLAVDERTLFQIGSVTKTMTTTLLLQLVEEGRVELGAAVQRSLPDFALADAGAAARVTVEHLLTHRGGWFGDHLLVHARAVDGHDLAAGVAALGSAPQLFEPGTVTSYNNAAFTVAGRLIEVLTGEPFAARLRRRALEPLGMSMTWSRADEAITHRVAAPHAPGSTGTAVLRNRGWQPGWELSPWDLPVGGVLSCAQDLARWARAWLDGSPVLGRAMADAALTERVPFGCFADGVGLGWLRRGAGDVDLWGHGGETVGYHTRLVLVPPRRFGLVVLANATSGELANRDVVRAALAACLGIDDAPAPVVGPRDADLDAYVGRYALPFNGREVALDRERPGHLRITPTAYADDGAAWYPPPGPPATAGFQGPDRLVVVSPADQAGERMEFGRDADGRVAWLRLGGRAGPRLPG
jgi:CubicO group peptidase (beta-lactamase class C family)